MCEIFPEVDNCCMMFSVRLGCLFISVLAIMTGVITMSVLERTNNANYKNLENVTQINSTDQAFSRLDKIIPSGVCAISLLFIFTGFILVFSTLTNEEGLTQVFVWLTFVAILIGYLLVVLIALECTIKDTCFLKDMDWLSSAAVLILVLAYLTLWIYFISVANSAVLNG